MYKTYKDMTIRNATAEDAHRLGVWWRDGSVMAHAGFPLGLDITDEEIAASLKMDTDEVHRRLIIEIGGTPCGEMNYRNMRDGSAEIGIKLCDASKQNGGRGKALLSMLIDFLFNEGGYVKIILDTNANNSRAQHVYEELGFTKLRFNENAWKDQLGAMQSSIDYSLVKEDFVSFIV